MKFNCCGVIYSTDDPLTYSCIDTFFLKENLENIIDGYKIYKQVVYLLCCKKNGCTKLELHSFATENGQEKLVSIRKLKGMKAIKFLKATKDLRVKQLQRCPLKVYKYSKKIPWVYGKAINGTTQIARYLDESGTREKFPKTNIVIKKTDYINGSISAS